MAAQPKPADKPLPPKEEPKHGIRHIRVRGRLADGREFVSTSAFLMPKDPDAEGGKAK